jgi:small subunit ribosomal protein S17
MAKRKQRGVPRERTGVVIGNKMDKTVVVEVRTTVLHPRYKKYIQRRRRFKAHDEKNACRLGDRVEIVESRPLSKTKHWRVRKVVEAARI